MMINNNTNSLFKSTLRCLFFLSWKLYFEVLSSSSFYDFLNGFSFSSVFFRQNEKVAVLQKLFFIARVFIFWDVTTINRYMIYFFVLHTYAISVFAHFLRRHTKRRKEGRKEGDKNNAKFLSTYILLFIIFWLSLMLLLLDC